MTTIKYTHLFQRDKITFSSVICHLIFIVWSKFKLFFCDVYEEQNASVAVNLHLSANDGASFVLNSCSFLSHITQAYSCIVATTDRAVGFNVEQVKLSQSAPLGMRNINELMFC